MSRLLATALAACALFMTSTAAAVDINAEAYGALAQQEQQADLQDRRPDDHDHDHDKCRGKNREWGAFHACDCRPGSATFEKSYRDCLDVSTNPPTILPTIDFKPCECPRRHGGNDVLSEEEEADDYAEDDEAEDEADDADDADEDEADDAEASEDTNVDAAGSKDDHHKPKPVPKPRKCRGKKDGFRFKWGAPHFCEPKDPKKCKEGEKGTTYEDCLAVDKKGREFITGLIRHVKCKVEKCPDHGKQVKVPTPKKCYGEEDGFRFDWGAPHACDPKDPKKCKVGEEGITYRDCLAISKKTGQQFITALNEQVKCKVERCDNKKDHDHGHKDKDDYDQAEDDSNEDDAAIEVLADEDDAEVEEGKYDDDKHVDVPTPKKCFGHKDGFRFEWGAPHACDPKDPKKCKVGEEGITYRDCLAIKKKTGEVFITALNEQVKCKVERCDNKKPHKPHKPHKPYALYSEEDDEEAEDEVDESVDESAVEDAEVEAEFHVHRPEKCEGKKDGFRFKWGAPHFCEPKDPKKCKDGEQGKTYQDCLAVDKKGNEFQTGLVRDVKCKVKCPADHGKNKDVPTPKKCFGKKDGFRFEWGAPHACDPKDPKKCKVGEEGITYRDCLAIKKKTGEVFITALNEQVKCKVERCDKKSSWLASVASLIFGA